MKYQSNLLRRAFSTTQSLLAATLVATVASAGLAADPDYFGKYESMRMTRDANGVLLLEMNTKGGPLKFSARDHEQFVDVFYDVGRDRDNKVVILTGKGGDWIGDIDFGSFGDVSDPDAWSKIHDEGTQVVENIANIRVPVICAVEGKGLGTYRILFIGQRDRRRK